MFFSSKIWEKNALKNVGFRVKCRLSDSVDILATFCFVKIRSEIDSLTSRMKFKLFSIAIAKWIHFEILKMTVFVI